MNKNTQTQSFLRRASITQKMLRKADARLSLHGISFTEYLILYHLDGAHLQTLRRIDLAEAVGLSASGVTRVIAPMIKNHLVEKCSSPRDARVSLVKLSAAGATIYSDSSQTLRYLAEDVYAEFKQKDLAMLADLEAKMVV